VSKLRRERIWSKRPDYRRGVSWTKGASVQSQKGFARLLGEHNPLFIIILRIAK
jgi:hypothetical protein